MLHLPAVLARLGIFDINIKVSKEPETEEELYDICSFVGNVSWEQYVAARDVYLRERGLRLIRQYRDRLLLESDWVETPYSQSTLANLDEWSAYRQCLRDLPSQIDSLTWVDGRPDFTSLNILPLPKTIRKNNNS